MVQLAPFVPVRGVVLVEDSMATHPVCPLMYEEPPPPGQFPEDSLLPPAPP